MASPLPFEVLGTDAAGELLVLQRAAYLSEAHAHADYQLPPLVESLTQIAGRLTDPDSQVVGIRDHGRLVGAVQLTHIGQIVELGRLVVAPDRQGEGLGTRLLLAADHWFEDTAQIRLFTGEHSESNLRLYTRHGYRETHRTRAGHYDLVHLTKVLN